MEMDNSYTAEDLKLIISKMFTEVKERKDFLGDLDGKSGDGDLGISMEAAFKAMDATCGDFQDGNDFGTMLLALSKSCNKAAPSTMGTLISSGIMAIAKAFKGKTALDADDLVRIPRIFTEALISRGKAKLGDKTILDALVPMYEAVELEYSKSSDIKESFRVGAIAAKTHAEATSGMRAKIGRAKWLGERAAEYPDAGATFCGIIAQSIL